MKPQLIATLATIALTACSEPQQPDSDSVELSRASAAEHPLAALSPGWNTINPDGDTICSDGTPYQFFVRPGDPEKLLIYFQGGGACWDGATCDPTLKPTYKMNVQPGELERYHGIFAFDEPDNPFADHSMVFAPYCTGDVHIGDAVVSYTSPATEQRDAREFEVHHRGYVNGEAILSWTFYHFRAPEQIFVTGSSAGAIPSPYYTMKVAEHYEHARIAQLGDAAGGYRSEQRTDNPANVWNTLSRLGDMPAFANQTGNDFRYETLYIAAASTYPDILFAEYDTAEDDVQRRFLTLGGESDDVSLLPLLEANQADIRAAVPNFRSFIAGGQLHTILARPEFYRYKVGDISVRDWVADLSQFKPVDNVRCQSCAAPEMTPAPTELTTLNREVNRKKKQRVYCLQDRESKRRRNCRCVYREHPHQSRRVLAPSRGGCRPQWWSPCAVPP